MPYRANIKKIEGLYGSKNSSVKAKLNRYCSTRFQDLEETFDTKVPLSAMLSDFFQGKSLNSDYAYLYWYMLEQMCDYFGNGLPNQHWYPSEVAELENIEILSHYTIGHHFLPAPDDFPAVYVCQQEQFDQFMKEAVSAITNKSQLRELKRWISFAKAENSDLIMFYY